jgi:two-component system, cell cycle sensor histidine kinase and response regulator CckA
MTNRSAQPRRPVVLVVDDEAAVRRLVSRILREGGGYDVIEAEDGLEALRIVEENLDRIDLVLTDIKMPVVDGIRLGHTLETLRPELPMAYMSGFGPEATALLRADLLEHCFITKPFTTDALISLVRRCLKPPRDSRDLVLTG